MAIGSAVQRGGYIYVYDEKGRQLTMVSGDSLQGYTSSSVSVRRGGYIYVFNERGRQLSMVVAR